MKKYLFFIIGSLILLTGCGKYGETDIINDLDKKINKSTGYYINGELEIMNNDDSYQYDVEVAYGKDENFKVSLTNKINNHEQIILKNEDGVYVLTPSLNKSFKFQSEWPYNNSQIYILQTLLKDIQNDKEKKFEETEDGYLFTTKVDYSNNSNLVNQQIKLDKNLNFKEVSIFNSTGAVQMKMIFNSIDYKATYDKTYFSLKGNVGNVKTKTTGKTLDSIIYPMYIPNNTKLSAQEKIMTDDGERIILTFSGESPFMLVQETASVPSDIETIPVYGEPCLVTGTVGALSDSSITWINNGVEFYVVSDVLSSEDLIDVANSITVSAVVK